MQPITIKFAVRVGLYLYIILLEWTQFVCTNSFYGYICMDLIPPSHRRRGANAVLVRHKPQCHRHDRRGSAVVSSLIAVKPRQIVKTADIRSPYISVTPGSRCDCGATAVLVRHKPQWYRHDRQGSAEVTSLIAVVPRKTINIADLRGGTAETLNMLKTSAETPRVGPIRSGIVEAPPLPPRHRHDRRGTVQGPQ